MNTYPIYNYFNKELFISIIFLGVFFFKDYIYRVYLLLKLITNLVLLIQFRLIMGYNSNYLFSSLYLVINQNGCLVIKLTQWIITRLNVYYEENQPEWLIKFNNFFENCPIHDLNYTNSCYKKLTGNNLSEDYIIDSEVVSSGSIGQVYKCFHRSSKEYHAIKSIHPNIKQQVLIPKMFILFITKVLYHIKFINKCILPVDFKGFFENLEQQLDFNLEVENIKKMQNIFKNESMIIIPEVINYNQDLIIMSYEDGTYYDDLKDISDYSKYKICLLYILFFHQCCLIDNFNHGDLHKGNWRIRLDDNNIDYKLVIYDFGLCFKQKKKFLMGAFIHGWEQYDVDKICNCLYEFYQDCDIDLVNNLVNDAKQRLKKLELKPFSLSKYLNIIYHISTSKGLTIDFNLFNFLISLILCENMLRKNGFLNRGTAIKDKSGNAIYQEVYQEYINFCQTKKCFPTLCQYYKEIVKKSGVKYNKLFGNLNKTLEFEMKSKSFNLSLEI